MNNNQKFKRGNLVHIAKDLGPAMSHFENDKNAIILYSYADKYQGDNTKSYAVMCPERGNTTAWYHEHQLTLIDEGGEHLIKEANKNRERISKQNTDINYIVQRLGNYELSSESILFLFKMIGHDTSFHKNGEFYTLYSDWSQFQPIFIHIKNSKTLEEAESIFTEEGKNQYNIKKVFESFNN